MIGVIIVTHGRLAEEFIKAAEHVVGKQERMRAVCIFPDDKGEQKREEIRQTIAAVDAGKGVVILTDMFGGTPSNLAIALMEPGKIEVLAGINLPCLIKLLTVRADAGVEEAVLAAQEAARKYINVASKLLRKAS